MISAGGVVAGGVVVSDDAVVPEALKTRYASVDAMKSAMMATLKKAETIGNNAFRKTGLKAFALGANVTSVGKNAFAGCTGLASVSLPDSVTELGWSAFYGCESLSSVRLSDNIKGFGDGVFANCVSLESITVPKKCASIWRNCWGSMPAIFTG